MSSIGSGISQRRSTTRMRARSSASSAEARRRIRTPLQNVNTVRRWVAGFLHGLATKAAPTERLEILNINGDPGLGICDGDELDPSGHHPRAGKATPHQT